MEPVDVTTDALNTVDKGKIFKDNDGNINSLSFTDDHKYLLTSGDDRKLNIYDVESGSREKANSDDPMGTSCVCSTHHSHACLYASDVGTERVIIYYNWKRQHAIAKLREHKGQVLCIAMSPNSDSFLSTSADGKMIMWDLRQRRSVFICDFALQRDGYVAFDPTGVAFALVHEDTDACAIKLFDPRNIDKGPFKAKTLSGSRGIKGFEFSDDGNLALASLGDGQIKVLDSMTLNQKQSIGSQGQGVAAFSACSKYVLASSCPNNSVKVFDVDSGREVKELQGHESPVTSLAWNKEYFLIASASKSLILWVPDLSRLSSSSR